MIVIDRKAPWIEELGWLVALLAELGRSPLTREYLHSMIPAIDDEQETSMMVERQASRIVELANIFAWLLGADRELDSSISAKRIVFHSKPSPTRDTRHARETPSKQATSNKNQSMKEQRTAPRSLPPTNHSLTHTSLFLIFIMILQSSSLGIGIGIGIGKRS